MKFVIIYFYADILLFLIRIFPLVFNSEKIYFLFSYQKIIKCYTMGEKYKEEKFHEEKIVIRTTNDFTSRCMWQ